MQRHRRRAAFETGILRPSRPAREDQDDLAVPQNVDCCLDGAWRRVQAIDRDGAALMQDPSRERRAEQFRLGHVAQLPWIDGVGHPWAVGPADLVAGDDRPRPSQP